MDNKRRKLSLEQRYVQKEVEIASLRQKLEYREAKLKQVTAEMEHLKEKAAQDKRNFETKKCELKSEVEKYKEQCSELLRENERMKKNLKDHESVKRNVEEKVQINLHSPDLTNQLIKITTELEQLKEEKARERINFEKEKSEVKSEIDRFKEQCTELQNAKERLQKLGQKLRLEKIMEVQTDFFPINMLPEEVILKIFGFLTHNKIGQIARVCRYWCTLTKSPILWRNVNVQFHYSHVCQSTITKNFIQQLPACVTSLRIWFKVCGAWNGKLNFREISVMLREKCPHLEALLLDFPKLTYNLQSIIDFCTLFLPKLKKLGFKFPEFTNSASTEECGDAICQIEALELRGIGSCQLENNKPPWLQLPFLKALHLENMLLEDDYFIDCTFLWSQLHTLDLMKTGTGSITFQAIRNHAVNIKELYLCDTKVQDSDLSFTDSVCTQLKTICLKNCYFISCDGVVSLLISVKSLENVFVNENIMYEYHERDPFIADDRCQLEIVKTGLCYHSLFSSV